MALRREKLNDINGVEATNELMALRAARKEQLAMEQIGTRITLETAAILNSGIVPPAASRDAHQMGEPAIVAQPGDEIYLAGEREDPVLH